MRSFVSGLARESTVRGDSTCLSEPNVQTLYWLVAQDASDAVQSAVASGTGSDSLLQYRATADTTTRSLCNIKKRQRVVFTRHRPDELELTDAGLDSQSVRLL